MSQFLDKLFDSAENITPRQNAVLIPPKGVISKKVQTLYLGPLKLFERVAT